LKWAGERKKQEVAFDEGEKLILSKFTLKRPKYASAYSNCPYSKEEIAAWDYYGRELKQFKNTNPEYIAWDKLYTKFTHEGWDEEAKLTKQLATADAKVFFNEYKNKYIFIVSYSDNETGETLLEHGEIFRGVPHVRCSHH
jgi:hypothetical protein